MAKKRKTTVGWFLKKYELNNSAAVLQTTELAQMSFPGFIYKEKVCSPLEKRFQSTSTVVEGHTRWQAGDPWGLMCSDDISRCFWDARYGFEFYFFIFNIYLAAPGLSCSTRDLVPWPGIEPGSPALGARSLNLWTTREVPRLWILNSDASLNLS